MPSHLGNYVRSVRQAAGLRIVEVARLAGLRDSPKMLRQLDALERTGNARPEVFEQVAQALNLDAAEVERACQRDQDDYERWMDEPVAMELIVRMMPAIYFWHRVPPGMSREMAISWALEQARNDPHQHQSCLKLSRRERVWISEGGKTHWIELVQRGAEDIPRMQIGKSRFRLVEPPKPQSD